MCGRCWGCMECVGVGVRKSGDRCDYRSEGDEDYRD